MGSVNRKLMIYPIYPDNQGVIVKVEGYTVTGLMKLLGKKEGAVREALSTHGIKPVIREMIYPAEALEILRNAPTRGRPRGGNGG